MTAFKHTWTRLAAVAGAVLASCIGLSGPVLAQAKGPAKTVVLVHGAFADGSSWQKVIPLLKDAGLKVIAVQNPLDSLDNDVAFTRRALDIAEGPVVLVGHSYGGVVITQAGLHDKVKSLVYVAAYAPEVGQSLADTAKPYPKSPGQAFFNKDAQGYLKISDEGIFKHFAPDLPPSEQAVVAATQGTFSIAAVNAPVTVAAWHKVPSFMVVATDDTIASPQMQRDEARRMGATTVEVASSHVAMLSHPDVVARMIIDAAK